MGEKGRKLDMVQDGHFFYRTFSLKSCRYFVLVKSILLY